MNRKTIVFIHGMYMTPLCWEKWIGRLSARGYTCVAPPWPGRDQPVEALRKKHPDPQLGRLTLADVINEMAASIQALDEKPVLVGHSMGALVTQLLLQRNLASAGVAIDSALPAGVFSTSWSFLKSNFPHINPLANQSVPIQMTLPRFQYTFTNNLPLDQQQAAFDRYVVPESRRVPAQSLTGLAHVDFHKPHPPLLLIAGGADHIIPASLNRTNFNRYEDSSSPSASVTSFKEFPGRTHFIIGQDGWEEVADYVITWIESLA